MRDGIMVPLDGSRFAEAALPAAIHLSRRDNLPLLLVTVWQPVQSLFDTARAREREGERRGERYMYMSKIARRVEEASGRAVSVEYLDGRPGDVLPRLPGPKGISLVVMATHARGLLKRACLGSVADQMVRKGRAPVLLVRPNEADTEISLESGGAFQRILGALGWLRRGLAMAPGR